MLYMANRMAVSLNDALLNTFVLLWSSWKGTLGAERSPTTTNETLRVSRKPK